MFFEPSVILTIFLNTREFSNSSINEKAKKHKIFKDFRAFHAIESIMYVPVDLLATLLASADR
jgi:hypothetical protein